MFKKFFYLLLFFVVFFSAPSPSLAQSFPNCAAGCSASCTANNLDNYPVHHADINLEVPSYQSKTGGTTGLIKTIHGPSELDPKAPQLNTLLAGNPRPAVRALYDICEWVWEGDGHIGHRENSPAGIKNLADYASMIALEAQPGQAVLVPQSGYDIGGGRQAIVLYATQSSVVIKYGVEDSVARGYAIQISNINVDGEVLAQYNALRSAGAGQLPSLCAGSKLGDANGEVLITMRDTGGYMDPRWEEDWWPNQNAGQVNTFCEIRPIKVEEEEEARGSRVGQDGPLYGRDPYDRMGIGTTPSPNRFTKSPYCPALGINQKNPGGGTEPNEGEFKYCTLNSSRRPDGGVFYSCPDYSPNRPYPGDTCFDFEDIKKENITVFSQPLIQKETKITYNLCGKDPASGDFSCVDRVHTVKAWVKTNVDYEHAFVDYLGTNNEYTSSPNYIMSLKNDIVRSNLYLTDFLRGFFIVPGDADRSREMFDYLAAQKALKEVSEKYVNDPTNPALIQAVRDYDTAISKIPHFKERLQLTSGVLNKIWPEAYKNGKFDSNKILIQRWLYANLSHLEDNERPKDEVGKTPVGDYVIAYTCSNTGKPLNEEDFPDSLERRNASDPETNEDCAEISPLRISDFICGNYNPENPDDPLKIWNDPSIVKNLKASEICRGKENWGYPGGESIFWIYWGNYFPLTTHEDTPVRVTIRCPSYGHPNVSSVKEDGGADYTEKELRENNIDVYAKPLGKDDIGQKYEIIHRFYVYVGHLAEARESAYFAQTLLPSAVQMEKDGSLPQISPMPSPLVLNSDVASGNVQAAGVETGDLVAEDAKWRYTPNDEKWKIDSVAAKKIELDKAPSWSGVGDPPKRTEKISGLDCEVKVEMPFIRDVAELTIGRQAGFMRAFMPKAVADQIDEQAEKADNRGANVANADYSGMGFELLEPYKDGGTVEETVLKPGKFYVPWVAQMQSYQKYLAFSLNPKSAQTLAGAVIGEGPPDFEVPQGEANVEWQKCMTQNIDFKNTGFSDDDLRVKFNLFNMNAKNLYGDNWLKKPEGQNLWIELGSTAKSGGVNPILALAYWGEETHFTRKDINPDPRMGLGCGKPPSAPSCITDYGDDTAASLKEFTEEFQCFAAKNPVTCNNACLNQADTWSFIGCYQSGAGNNPSNTHVGNLVKMYYSITRETVPDCSQFLK